MPSTRSNVVKAEGGPEDSKWGPLGDNYKGIEVASNCFGQFMRLLVSAILMVALVYALTNGVAALGVRIQELQVAVVQAVSGTIGGNTGKDL